MPFVPKGTKQKVKASYKTLYISDELMRRVSRIAEDSGTSFNNVVVSMIEYCLNEGENPAKPSGENSD